jgi:heme exporter protein D
MEGFGGIAAIIIIVLAVLYLVAPLKLFSIHSELQKIRKLLEAETQRQQRERNLRAVSDS